MASRFFEVQREQSYVKSRILSEYFATWAQIIINVQERIENRYHRPKQAISYIDLFAGPGIYEDDSKSTPALVLEEAAKDKRVLERIQIILNDGDADNATSLNLLVDTFEDIHKFKYRPVVRNEIVDNDLVRKLKEWAHVPTLMFVDPFGYKGLSLELISAVLKDWGCDCVFFFNYNRVNMGVDNPIVDSHMRALFGEAETEQLRRSIRQLESWEREVMIVERLVTSLRQSDGDAAPRFVLPFRFKDKRGTRTSHYLVFVSKDQLGYEKMKEIMAKKSSGADQPVASFEYNPATERQPFLLQFTAALDDLAQTLLCHFAGETLKMIDIFKKHNVNTPFVKSNYKTVLRNLYELEEIRTNRKPHGKHSFADDIIVTFPPRNDAY